MVNSKKFNYKEGINIVIENNIFSKNKDKNGNPKGKGMGGDGGTPNNFIPPSIRQPQTMPDIDTLVSPFVDKMRADMMAKNFYGRRFNEFNPYDNLLTNGGHQGFQNNYYGNHMIEDIDDDEEEEQNEIIQPEEEEVQQPEEGEIEEEVVQAPVVQPKDFFDEEGKYLLPRTTPEQRKVFNHHKYIRKLYIERKRNPQPKSIRAYGLQNYFNT